ncbi:helix-turn-helix transcriptional regulator [bacterium]|nr:helix-turn-helix transcriptional regulator [bacterium]
MNTKIGKKIKIERIKRDLTQEQLAFEANLNRTTISSIERGIKSPTVDTLEAIAKVFGITLQEMFNFDNL